MKFANASLGLLLVFLSLGSAEAGGKPYPTNMDVELSGSLKEGAGPDANGNREEYYVLVLDDAISVEADEFGEAAKGVTEVQMVPLSRVRLKRFLGKRIVVKGRFFHAITAHHHTRVLLEVRASNAVRLGKSRDARGDPVPARAAP